MFKIRLPRTKSNIEANAKRKQLLKNFKKKLKELQKRGIGRHGLSEGLGKTPRRSLETITKVWLNQKPFPF